jgi:DnaJ domain.
MKNSQIDISPRKAQLKEEYERLQKEYSELVEKRDDMLYQEAPKLEAIYMESIGQLQYEILQLEYDIALLKLERDLMQSFVNRGEEPELETVEEQVEEQAKVYNENLHQEEEKIKQAKAFIEQQKEEENKQKDAEKIELKQLYKRLVHRLHPDLHPEQTEWERELFLKVQEAYANEDLERLRQLEAELDAGMPFTSVEGNTVDEWEARVTKLKEQIAAIRQEIEDLNNQFPFTYRDKLNSQEWIAAKQEELRVRIEMLQKEKERLEQIVNMMKGKAA